MGEVIKFEPKKCGCRHHGSHPANKETPAWVIRLLAVLVILGLSLVVL